MTWLRLRDASLLEDAVGFARELDLADHFLVQTPVFRSLPRGVTVVHENASYFLLRLGGTFPGD